MGQRIATEEQVAEVRRLRAAGESLRSTAAAVFGSGALKDRVARLERGRGAEAPNGAAGERDLIPAESHPRRRRRSTPGPQTVRARIELVQRQLDRRLARGERVSASELVELEKLERQLEQRESFERLRQLTRES